MQDKSRDSRNPISFRSAVLLIATVLYAVGIWLHIPYGGGHIYSDIVTVFQGRECSGTCLTIPYVNGFIEYPIIVSLFIYSMGYISSLVSTNVIGNYYALSVIVLALPTLLLVDETMKVARIMGIRERRVLSYLVVTPTFIFILLVNWYVIGVYFAVLGLRKFLEGSRTWAGVFLGLSAASNLVTAAPAFGMLLSERRRAEALRFAVAVGGTFLALNAPFALLNPKIWISFWQYESSWYIEGSWMLAVLNRYSPLRHYFFPILLAVLFATIFVIAWRTRPSAAIAYSDTTAFSRNRAVLLSSLTTFAFLFSTYVCTPQMNLMLLPFFVILPMASGYWEFLAFEVVNALVIVVGFSQPLLDLGITIKIDAFSYFSIIQWLAILRSLWIGKFLIWDGFLKLSRRLKRGQALS